MKDIENRPLSALTSSIAMFRVVCRNSGGVICGEITNASFNKAIAFSDLGQMLLAIDDMCETMQFPMADTKPRFLNDKTARDLQPLAEMMNDSFKEYTPCEWAGKLQMPSGKAVSSSSPKKGITFFIHVMYRQHSSMQGLVLHKSKASQKACFRSGLELIRMMDSFLNND